MASTTDTLQTVIELTGAATYIREMTAAATANQALAVAETAATGGAAALAGTLGVTAAVGTAALTAGFSVLVGLVGEAIHAFGESELVAVRLDRTMRNLGNAFPADQLQRFASELSEATGIDDELIASLGGLAAQFGLTRAQIERLLPTVLDAAALNGLDPEQVERVILRASRGRAQGLIAIGIDPSKIQGDIHDIDNLLTQLGAHFAGGAEDVRNTVPGALTALATSVENLFEAFGRFFGGTTVSLINLTINAVDSLTDALDRLADLAEGAGALIGHPSARAAGDNLTLKGDPEQTGLLGQIADNTRTMKDELVGRVLGGPGTVARGAAGLRDFTLAFAT